MLLPKVRIVKQPAADRVAADMHVKSSRLYLKPRVSCTRVKRMHTLRSAFLWQLIHPASRQTGWLALTPRCHTTVASVASAKPVRQLVSTGDRPKGKRWETVDKWVMFSDLHVSVKTLEVCLSVLRKIKKEAVARKAGIVFLGENI